MNLSLLSGILIFASFLITIFSYFFLNELFIFSGIFAWLALILLFRKVSNIKLLILLLGLSFAIFLFCMIKNFQIDFARAILVNQYLLTLLIGVGFLRLIATPKNENIKELPTGKNSFIKTYWGVHLFGSVINLSSLILVADKLYKRASLSKLQIILLTRAFSTDAYWSPFFVAFAAAITYAPNLMTSKILVIGIVLAVTAFFITLRELKDCDFSEFRGYPMQFDTLLLPFLLAILVLVTNHYYPNLKVILLISMFSILLTSLILPFKVGIKNAIKNLNSHVTTELPKMKNEIALFLVAGMFGVSVSSLLMGYNIDFPFKNFDAFAASIMLLVFILVSFIGIHPIISIAIVGNWTMDLNHTLLAATFLMSWSTSVSTSPFSGVNLTMQARYDLNAKEIFKTNLPYAFKMYIFCVIILFLLAKYLGI
ncbi:tellurium resistance protein TerC [Halarcobacter ebronensis]|uniref:Tellurium resistance protein TerC n=1 Tax=Halarcobacter ebronensis TaxID=1462615 RepID=A0A4Q1B0Z7_9BACT|nr:tellurium resistance protein TerC [Halarcobacter ebronensis]RXK08713.1 tellurium resistance protein TerC [Halarcobacter ebronensis]